MEETEVDRQIREARQDKRTSNRMDEFHASSIIAWEMSEIMDKRNLNLLVIAKSMGISAERLRRILDFEALPSLSTIWKFARAVDCNLKVSFVSKDSG